MHSLKKTGTDFSSAKGMDPKAFFDFMGACSFQCSSGLITDISRLE
jgi:hypothetical protein